MTAKRWLASQSGARTFAIAGEEVVTGMRARRIFALLLFLTLALYAPVALASLLDTAADQIRSSGDRALSLITRYNWLTGIVGALLIIYGYRLYFLVVALAGIVVGGTFGHELVAGPQWATLVAALVGALVGGALSVMLHGVAIFALAAVPGYLLGIKFGGAVLWGVLGGVLSGALGIVLTGIGVAAATSFAGGLMLSMVIFGHQKIWFAVTCIFIGLILQGLTVGIDGREEKASGRNLMRRVKGLFRTRSWSPFRRKKRSARLADVPAEAYRAD